MADIIEGAMPEGRTKKEKDKLEQTSGGGTIFIPAAKKKKTKLPKSYDPENPGPMPDPERWLPKWQRRKNRRRFRGAKGAQGDALNVGKVHVPKTIEPQPTQAK